MRNEDQKPAGRSNNFIPTFRAISRIVSSGASTVASTVRSAASAIVERDSDAYNDQVFWAGFDKLECEGGSIRRILLLGYRFGFQIWDVEEANNVREITSRYDGHVSFMQMLPNPLPSKQSDDKFSDNRPLIVVCADSSFSGGCHIQDGLANRSRQDYNEPLNGGFVPTAVWFYSLKSHSYVHVLKFRSAVYSVRCSSRVIAVLLAAEIHWFDAATLEREYAILTNRIVTSPGPITIGLGPLALGPRWIAYSGSPVTVSDSGRVSPQHITPSASFPNPNSNSSLVAHYAKESSKQIAAGIVTLGDIGYKKLSRYYSDILPDGYNKDRAVTNAPARFLHDTDNLGMVVVRDVVSRSVIAQFRAHKSPILSLCFDPSGTLLVTASNHGNNINIFRITPAGSDSASSYVQIYTLQRGFTNAVIQDVSFSDDSNWIMISSTRTSHLFAISVNQQNCSTNHPVTLSAVSRIRSGGGGGLKGSVTGMAAAATGKGNLFSGAIASTFHNCKDRDFGDTKYNLLVFSHPGCVIQYALRNLDSGNSVEAIQKWNIFQKQSRRDREENNNNNNTDIYGENGNNNYQDSGKIFPEVGARVSKVKMNNDEKQHMFISEAELEMHEPRVPLWGKPEIYFQSMIKDEIEIDEENALGGEIEIEEVPVRMIEPRSKDLVPVHAYLQAPKLQQPRATGIDGNNPVSTPRWRSGSSENSRISRRSSNVSLDSMMDGGVAFSETHAGSETSNGNSVKKNDGAKIVNNDNREGTESMFVNNNVGSKMEDEGDDDEVD